MSRILLALSLAVAARPGRRAGARAANADLEGAIRDAYVDKHQVHHGTIQVDGETVEFLEAGPKGGKTVIFCHGAAFSMTTSRAARKSKRHRRAESSARWRGG